MQPLTKIHSMKIIKESVLFIVLTTIFISCSSKDDTSSLPEENSPQSIIISGYTINYLGVLDNPNVGLTETTTIGTIESNKIQKTTFERIYEGQSQGLETKELYGYASTGELVLFRDDVPVNHDIRDFVYDNDDNLIAIT